MRVSDPVPDDATNDGVSLTEVAAREDVRAAIGQAEASLAHLRFHEGLRRGWEEARAEAAVREAWALASLEGVRIGLDDLRALTMLDVGMAGADSLDEAQADPGVALAVGIWRAQWSLTTALSPLNTRTPVAPRSRSLPGLVAGWHRDICSGLASRGMVDPDRVAVPTDPARMTRVLRMAGSSEPSLVVAARILAEFRREDLVSPGSLACGATVARWILVQRGLDPTGVAVISALDVEDAPGAGRALGGWIRGDEDGVADWIIRVAAGVERGAHEGEDVALRVQAGRLR